MVGNIEYDLHNHYELKTIRINVKNNSIIFEFSPNQYSIRKNELKLSFCDIEYLRLDQLRPENYLDELGYKDRSDFDMDWLSDEKHFNDDSNFIIRFDEDKIVRISSKLVKLEET